MNKTCGTCKFRGKDIETFKPANPFERTPTGYFLCERINHSGDGDNAPPIATGAHVIDGSGYYAALCVASDFGCVLHEPS